MTLRFLPHRIRALVLVVATCAVPLTLTAQSGAAPMEGIMGRRPDAVRIGGHVGFVVPAVRRSRDVTTDLFDRFVFGVPVGLTIKPAGRVAVDFEFIPTFNTGDDFVLTIHPGVIVGVARSYALGVRAAFDAGSANESFGLTPLISRGFGLTKSTGWFLELDLPIRRNRPSDGGAFTAVAVAAHIGVTF